MFDDIIDTKYPFDLNHKRMSNYERCAQFMPFSALVGYKEAVVETARITDDRIILDEEAKEILDKRLANKEISDSEYIKRVKEIDEKIKKYKKAD